jgi:hypothetical protein
VGILRSKAETPELTRSQRSSAGVRLSVIICTHNPRDGYFTKTLQALASQGLPAADWELLVIDNASAPPLAGRLDLRWHPNARIIAEGTLGLTAARLRGIREAQGDLLVFVDDDNVLDPDFLEQALQVAQSRPWLGSWSGQCRGGFESPPPDWTRRYWGNLVIREFAEDRWSNLPLLGETMPCGAGLCVRRAVALEYLRQNDSGARALQLDRAGTSLLSGGDNDLAACACDLGLGVGLISALKLTHLVPPERLTLDYLSRLAEGIYHSSIVLAHIRGGDAATAQYRVRPHHWVRAMLHPAPHRTVQLAALRGKRAGWEWVRQHGTTR